jgi:hypothetical protein
MKTLAAICASVALLPVPAIGQEAPRDLSGVWIQKEPAAALSATTPRMTAWGEALFRANKPTVGPAASRDSNDPTVACFPAGVPYILTVPVPFEFVQTSNRIVQLFEYNHNVRRLYADGRSHPLNLQETLQAQWMGHSTAQWDGQTLVVDTVGFNDRTWLDRAGHPHSSDLHLIERIRRVTTTTLEYNITIDDPNVYVIPWTARLEFVLRPGWDILEHNCVPEDEDYRRYKETAWH